MERYDIIEEVNTEHIEKYNHNHDALGRFSSGSGGRGGGGGSKEKPESDAYEFNARRRSLASKNPAKHIEGSIKKDKVQGAVDRGGRLGDFEGKNYLISPQGNGTINVYIGSKTKSGGFKPNKYLDGFRDLSDAHDWTLGTILNGD